MGLSCLYQKNHNNIEYLNKLIEKEFPIVLFNRISDSLPVSKVVFDDYKWAFFATEHLIQQGLKNIIHLSGPKNNTLSNNREKGFIDAHRNMEKMFQAIKLLKLAFLLRTGSEL